MLLRYDIRKMTWCFICKSENCIIIKCFKQKLITNMCNTNIIKYVTLFVFIIWTFFKNHLYIYVDMWFMSHVFIYFFDIPRFGTYFDPPIGNNISPQNLHPPLYTTKCKLWENINNSTPTLFHYIQTINNAYPQNK